VQKDDLVLDLRKKDNWTLSDLSFRG